MGNVLINQTFAKVFLPVFVFFSILFYGCNDDPAPVGYSFLYDTVAVLPLSSGEHNLFDYAEQVKVNLPMFNTGEIYLGAANGVKTLSFLRFGFGLIPDSVKEAISSEDRIISADLFMFPGNYQFGDTLSNKMSFDIFKISRLFTNYTTWDSLFAGGQFSDYIDYSNVYGTFDEPVVYEIIEEDSVKPIQTSIEKSIVSEWFRMIKDSALAQQIWGLALVPDWNNCDVIHQFSGLEINTEETKYNPWITVKYLDKDNNEQEINIESSIQSSFLTAEEPQNKQDIVLQGGIEYRTKLHFDLSMIPKNAGIHKASLELTLNTELSAVGNDDIDSTISAAIMSDTTVYSSILGEYIGYRQEGSDKYYFRSISSAIENWVRKDGKGFLLMQVDGFNNRYRSLERLVFYGMDAPEDKKPKLNIIYSTRPDYKD